MKRLPQCANRPASSSTPTMAYVHVVDLPFKKPAVKAPPTNLQTSNTAATNQEPPHDTIHHEKESERIARNLAEAAAMRIPSSGANVWHAGVTPMVFVDALAHAFECEDRQRDACWNPTNRSKERERVSFAWPSAVAVSCHGGHEVHVLTWKDGNVQRIHLAHPIFRTHPRHPVVFADALAHAFECEDRQRDACWNMTNRSKERARVFRLALSSCSLMSAWFILLSLLVLLPRYRQNLVEGPSPQYDATSRRALLLYPSLRFKVLHKAA